MCVAGRGCRQFRDLVYQLEGEVEFCIVVCLNRWYGEVSDGVCCTHTCIPVFPKGGLELPDDILRAIRAIVIDDNDFIVDGAARR